MNIYLMKRDNKEMKVFFENAGFWCLCITLFMLSFPRSWSLYPLGFMLFTGLVVWILDFRNLLDRLVKMWFLIFPPVIYFIIHFISVVFMGAEIELLEDRLMFLLIPLLGFPVFISSHAKSRLSAIFSVYILGIAVISLFLVIRIFYMIGSGFPGGINFFSWLSQNELSYFSMGFAVLEHPTYFALKVNWALILLLFFSKLTCLKPRYVFLLTFLFSAVLLFTASKAGLLMWLVVLTIYLIKAFIKGFRKPVMHIGVILLFVAMAVVFSMRINRLNSFVTSLKTQLTSEHRDWKYFDQRTREWYSALQVIREHPLFGTGLSKAQERLVEEYTKNGFNDEAALRLNTHNQFLEAQMTFGLFGTVSLLIMLLAPLICLNKTVLPGLIISLTGLTIFFLLIESLFNRQWGIMFFLLFYFVIVVRIKEH